MGILIPSPGPGLFASSTTKSGDKMDSVHHEGLSTGHIDVLYRPKEDGMAICLID